MSRVMNCKESQASRGREGRSDNSGQRRAGYRGNVELHSMVVQCEERIG
jgi:hypothetical protein